MSGRLLGRTECHHALSDRASGHHAEEDRKERRRKLGLPEELTEEEKAAERARLAESAKAKPSIGLPVKPISLLAQLRDALVRGACCP